MHTYTHVSDETLFGSGNRHTNKTTSQPTKPKQPTQPNNQAKQPNEKPSNKPTHGRPTNQPTNQPRNQPSHYTCRCVLIRSSNHPKARWRGRAQPIGYICGISCFSWYETRFSVLSVWNRYETSLKPDLKPRTQTGLKHSPKPGLATLDYEHIV